MATTSRPDHLDYTILGLIVLFLLIVGAYAIIPTKIWRGLNPDFSTRLHWLAILVYGIFTILFIPFPIYMDLHRPPARFSHASWRDCLFMVALTFPPVLIWVIFWTKMISFGLRIFYRCHPTWFPYLMEVDPKFAKYLEMEVGDEAKDLEYVIVKA